MREKLVELLKKAKAKKQYDFLFGDIDTAIDMPHGAEYYADYLIANDVTVQEWIPVTERLPEDWVPVLVMVRETKVPLLGSYRENVWFHEKWNTAFINGAVTHWMPLPQPPKGE